MERIRRMSSLINYFDIIAVVLVILRYYGLIEISGWWILLWFTLGFVDSVLLVLTRRGRG
jgi:hypothetical protein